MRSLWQRGGTGFRSRGRQALAGVKEKLVWIFAIVVGIVNLPAACAILFFYYLPKILRAIRVDAGTRGDTGGADTDDADTGADTGGTHTDEYTEGYADGYTDGHTNNAYSGTRRKKYEKGSFSDNVREEMR